MENNKQMKLYTPRGIQLHMSVIVHTPNRIQFHLSVIIHTHRVIELHLPVIAHTPKGIQHKQMKLYYPGCIGHNRNMEWAMGA
jgi:hypothetical protein